MTGNISAVLINTETEVEHIYYLHDSGLPSRIAHYIAAALYLYDKRRIPISTTLNNMGLRHSRGLTHSVLNSPAESENYIRKTEPTFIYKLDANHFIKVEFYSVIAKSYITTFDGYVSEFIKQAFDSEFIEQAFDGYVSELIEQATAAKLDH